MTAEYADYDTPGGHATAIYGKGVPLARKKTSLGSGVTKTVAGGGSATLLTTVAVDQPAIEIVLNAQLPSGALGTPFAKLSCSWIDAATTDQMALRNFILASGDGQGNRGQLFGVTRGDQLTLTLLNLHATQILTYDWDAALISHVINDDDWNSIGAIPVSGFTLPGGDISLAVPAAMSLSIGPNASVTRLMPSSNRRCKICIDNSAQLNACEVKITDPAPSIAMYGLAAGAQFYRSGAITAGSVVNSEFQMPNGPALVTVANLAATNMITVLVTITAMPWT